MPVSLREAARITGIHEKTLLIYVRKGYLQPAVTKSSKNTLKYLFSPADIDRALQIYTAHQQNIRLKHPNLANFHQKTREKALKTHGQPTNRVGRAPVATGTRGVLSH